MNPGLVVKLRPAGPWRIGPDSGARNRVDVIYHSDSLYSAVTSAMARLGLLEEWLAATAREGATAVCFSSCFPFLDEIGFVIPPRTIWPPTSPALMSARVRWKSARFVPLGIVQALLSGQTLNGNHWSVDGPSECLVPTGRPGPFRTGVRFNAAVDRLTGSTERHSTACIEFRPGSGLWTIVSFQDETARDHWSDPVKAAFRLLADTGFGGERSRGWGRSEAPEFVEGTLPELILPPVIPHQDEVTPAETASVRAAAEIAPLAVERKPAPEPAKPEPTPAPELGPDQPPPLESDDAGARTHSIARADSSTRTWPRPAPARRDDDTGARTHSIARADSSTRTRPRPAPTRRGDDAGTRTDPIARADPNTRTWPRPAHAPRDDAGARTHPIT